MKCLLTLLIQNLKKEIIILHPLNDIYVNAKTSIQTSHHHLDIRFGNFLHNQHVRI